MSGYEVYSEMLETDSRATLSAVCFPPASLALPFRVTSPKEDTLGDITGGSSVKEEPMLLGEELKTVAVLLRIRAMPFFEWSVFFFAPFMKVLALLFPCWD